MYMKNNISRNKAISQFDINYMKQYTTFIARNIMQHLLHET